MLRRSRKQASPLQSDSPELTRIRCKCDLIIISRKLIRKCWLFFSENKDAIRRANIVLAFINPALESGAGSSKLTSIANVNIWMFLKLQPASVLGKRSNERNHVETYSFRNFCLCPLGVIIRDNLRSLFFMISFLVQIPTDRTIVVEKNRYFVERRIIRWML